MKRLIILSTILMLFGYSSNVMADASTCNMSWDYYGSYFDGNGKARLRKGLVMEYVTSTSDGNFTDCYANAGNTNDRSFVVDGTVMAVDHIPDGTNAPQNNITITLKDPNGVEFMGNEMDNCDNVTPAQFAPAVGSTYAPKYARGTPELEIADNNQASGSGKIIIHIVE